jgi:hypothetical protein
MPGDEVEHFLVPKPFRCLTVDLDGRRAEKQTMPPVLQGRHVGVARHPLVHNDDGPTRRGEPAGDSVAVQTLCIGLPAEQFLPLGLTECLQKANPVSVAVEFVYVVDDERLVSILIGESVDAEGARVARNPADLVPEGAADTLAFTEARVTEYPEEGEIALPKRPGVLLELLVGADAEELFG